ncbi:unnamed protein product, partial [Allacma fusca]
MKQNKRFENNLFKKLPRRKRRQLIRDLHNGVALNFTDIFTLPVTEGSVSESTVVGDRSNYFQKPNEYSPAEVPTCAGVNAESIEFQNSINSEQDNEKCFIHPYCELSPEESNLIITAFALKHNLTKVGTEDLLTLLALHMPRDSFLPSSFYSLRKDLNVDQTSCTTHYICSNCKAYVNAEDSFCEECNFQINVADLRSSNNYFFTFNPAVMLKEILQSEAVADNLAANLRRRNLENTTHVEDIVHGRCYKALHLAFLGVSKMFTLLWIESSNSSAPYYIGNKVKRMEKLLLNAKVPYEFDRTLRSFSTIKYWKASEWRSWTYVCFSITKGFLPDVYRKHFLKYANSIMLLSDEKITELDFLHAQDQLHSFVYQAKNLYGMKCCTFNLHILLHATNCVRNWGPLWAYSAFQFENFNGILSSMFRSSQQVLTQIRSRFLELMALKHHGTRRIENPVVLEYFQSLLSSHRFMHSACKTNDGCVFLGPSKDYIFSDEEKIKLARIKITCAKGRSFRKCIIHGKIFCTEENATTKRNNAIVAT